MGRRDQLADASQYSLFGAPVASLTPAGVAYDELDDAAFLVAVLSLTMPAQAARRVAAQLKAAGQVTAALAGNVTLDGLAVPPAAVHALNIVRSAAQRLTRAEVRDSVLLGSYDKVIAHCRATIGHSPVERLQLLFVDRRNRLIADEIQQRGTVDHVPLYPREVARRALELGAAAVIISHNHPSGDPSPSRADIEMTKAVAEALKTLGILLHDHIIVSAEAHSSFKSLGLL